jgi:hypothetical protein
LRLIKRRSSPREVAHDIYNKKLHFYHSELETKDLRVKVTKVSQKLKVKSDEARTNLTQVRSELKPEINEKTDPAQTIAEATLIIDEGIILDRKQIHASKRQKRKLIKSEVISPDLVLSESKAPKENL